MAATLSSIYEEGKKKRLWLSKTEYAASLGYSRPHLHRIMTGDDPVPQNLLSKAQALLNDTKDVSKEVKIESTPEHLFERIIERQAASNAAIKIVLAELAEMKSKVSGASFVSEFSAWVIQVYKSLIFCIIVANV